MDNNKTGLGRDFWIYRLGQCFSLMGDSIGLLALGWWILEKTGSAAVMGSLLAVPMAIGVILTPMFGPLGDRYSRKHIIAVSDFLRALVFGGLLAVVWLDYYQPWLLMTLFTLNTASTALFSSSSRSIVPQLVTKERLKDAINKTEGINAMAGILGGLAGGVLVSTLGVAAAFGVNIVTFLVSALTALLIRANTRATESGGVMTLGQWWSSVKEGFKVVFKVRILFGLALVVMMINFTVAPLSVLIPYLVKEVEQLPAWYVGVLESGLAVGSIVGVVIFGLMAKKVPLDRILLLAFFVLGSAIGLMSLDLHIYLVLVAVLFIGIAVVWANVVLSSQVMASVPDVFRSRIGATLGFMGKGIEPVSLSAVGVSVDYWGFSQSLMTLGIIALVVAPTLYLLPHFKRFMRLKGQASSDFLLEEYPVLARAVEKHKALAAKNKPKSAENQEKSSGDKDYPGLESNAKPGEA
ncbi:MFS transporter [Thalassomonas viridans]|uniref:Multidrug efflux pump Tap n=1 Tax=Thalassomonas viridans TaxID=137584 RepID=A0AAE9Z4W0_9GAMM|nr:MFS transporter [Thalassomonas viridans]WDE05303.1 MFS transporter [Thalassomonas viridans]